MTAPSNHPFNYLIGLADFLSEDVCDLSREELEERLRSHGLTVESAAASGRRALERAKRTMGRTRFEHARAEVARAKAQVIPFRQPGKVDPEIARRALQDHIKRNPQSTLAARKGQGLTDDSAVAIYESLVELGLITPDQE
jgi:hypothetical protein